MASWASFDLKHIVDIYESLHFGTIILNTAISTLSGVLQSLIIPISLPLLTLPCGCAPKKLAQKMGCGDTRLFS